MPLIKVIGTNQRCNMIPEPKVALLLTKNNATLKFNAAFHLRNGTPTYAMTKNSLRK